MRPSATLPDAEGVALVVLEGVAPELSELAVLEGVVPELSELAVLIAELAEQAERGAATATEAIRSVMDLELITE